MKIKKLKIKAIMFDIDETIVTSDTGAINYFNEVLADMLAERKKVSKEAALSEIESLETRCIRKDAFFTAAHLGFSMDEVFQQSLDWMKKNGFKTFPDAVFFIRSVYAKGLRLFTLTNNGALGVLVKLLPSGLANRNGESLFEKFYGDDSLGGNKADSRVYKKFLENESFTGKDVLMVGDNRIQDGENALKAGIKNVVIIDRSQSAAIRREGKLLIVNNLNNLISLIV